MAAPVNEGDILAGKYRVERVLGEGGMGVVVAATHIQLEQKVALKFLLPHALANAEAVGRFLREGRACVKLKGEHVAKVSDVGTLENGSPYMVMEYLEGMDLSEVLSRRGRLPLDEAIDFLCQAGEAVAEAHNAGIVHRDLKPANFFITKRHDGTALLKVLDFGISKMGGGLEGGMTKTTAVMGSPFYMSPEQMRSSRNVDSRSDLWAMGIIFFELLTGGVAFNADTMPELCANVLTNPTPSIRAVTPEVPPGIEQIINRCLEKDPTRRYQSAAELARDLAPFAPERARTNIERIIRMQGGGEAPPRSSMASMAEIPRTVPQGGALASSAQQTVASWGAPEGAASKSGRGVMAMALGGAGVVVVGGIIVVVLLLRGGTKDSGGAASPPLPASAPALTASTPPSAEPAPTATIEVKPATSEPTPSATAVIPKGKLPPSGKPVTPPGPGPKPPVTPPKGNDDPFGNSRH